MGTGIAIYLSGQKHVKKDSQMIPVLETKKSESHAESRCASDDLDSTFQKNLCVHDRVCDGQSFCSVVTMVDCGRSSCASRCANRGSVTVYVVCGAVERGGLCPCKNCKPNEPTCHERYAAKVAEAFRLLESAKEQPEFDDPARAVGHRILTFPVGV